MEEHPKERTKEEMKDTNDPSEQFQPAPHGNPDPTSEHPRRTLPARDDDEPRRTIPRSERGDILTVAGTRARALETTLRAAGYAIMPHQHDDLIHIRDDTTDLYASISDQNGGRLLLRTCHLIRPDASPEERDSAVSELNRLVWAKFMVDEDGDLHMVHEICCLGGVHLPNLMRTIRQFFGLCQFVRSHDKFTDLFAGRRDDDASGDEE